MSIKLAEVPSIIFQALEGYDQHLQIYKSFGTKQEKLTIDEKE